MRTLILVLLASLFPFMASARLVEQIYDTNSQLVVDAHVVALISAPTGGVSAASVSNIVLNMANSLGVSNSAYSSNFVGRIITNQFNLGIDITNPASKTVVHIDTNGIPLIGNPNSGAYAQIGGSGVGGSSIVLHDTNSYPPPNAVLIEYQPTTLQRQILGVGNNTYSNALTMTMIGSDSFLTSWDTGATGMLILGNNILSDQEIEIWCANTIDFGSSANGVFPNNLDLRFNIASGLIQDGNLATLIDFGNHNFYATDGTIFYTGDSTHAFRGNGASITNLISTNEVVTTTTFASATNKLVLNNGRWLLQSTTPGSLTNITVAAPYTWATLVVSNSSAATNSFLISAAARYFGAVSTNLLQVYPGKMAYISIDALANVWTNICTVTQQ